MLAAELRGLYACFPRGAIPITELKPIPCRVTQLETGLGPAFLRKSAHKSGEKLSTGLADVGEHAGAGLTSYVRRLLHEVKHVSSELRQGPRKCAKEIRREAAEHREQEKKALDARRKARVRGYAHFAEQESGQLTNQRDRQLRFLAMVRTIARCSVCFESLEDLTKGLSQLLLDEHAEHKVVGLENGFHSSTPPGADFFRSVRIYLTFPLHEDYDDDAGVRIPRGTTLLCVVQLVLKEWLALKKELATCHRVLKAQSWRTCTGNFEKYLKKTL